VCLDWQKLILQIQRLTDFKAKMNKSKINKYKINNKTNTKHEFNVKYERYKQDISKDTLQMQKKSEKNPTFLRKHVSLSCLHFSLIFSEGEVKSPYFLQVWWALFRHSYSMMQIKKKLNDGKMLG
jgi:hypothetical protein